MKNPIFLVSIFALIITSCESEIGAYTEFEQTTMSSDLAKYFNGKATVNKSEFHPLLGGNQSIDFKITIQRDSLHKYYGTPSVPASFCAWQIFTNLSEKERNSFHSCTVQIPFDNQERVFEYPLEDLLMAFEAKYFLDSMTNYFIHRDYKAMQSKYHPLMKKDKALPEFQKKLEKLDADYGETKEVKFRGFEIVEIEDGSTGLSPRLVRFHVLQIRDKAKVKFSVTLDPYDPGGFICGISF